MMDQNQQNKYNKMIFQELLFPSKNRINLDWILNCTRENVNLVYLQQNYIHKKIIPVLLEEKICKNKIFLGKFSSSNNHFYYNHKLINLAPKENFQNVWIFSFFKCVFDDKKKS